MKPIFKLIVVVLFFLPGMNAFSQGDFDSQIKKMSDTLVNRLIRTGKTRVAVSNFVDLQGNVTELGKYIAEAFSVELSNTELKVVDRSRVNDLMQELKLTDEKLTKPENALKLGEMAGVEYIITGTTVPLETTVDITIKALDIQNGISVAGQRGSVPKTDAINNQMNSNVIQGNTTAANVNAGQKIDAGNKSATDVIMEVGITDLRKIECEVPSGTSRGTVFYYGQACFENRTEYDLVVSVPESFIGIPSEGLQETKVLIPKGGKNCFPKMITSVDNETATRNVPYTFTIANSSLKKSGKIIVTLETCKIKSIVVSKRNLYLE